MVNPAASRLLGIGADELLSGFLANNPIFAPVLQLVSRVDAGGFPVSIIIAGIEWSLTPRSGGGVVSTLSPVQHTEGDS
ncbi:hypothetical protein [Breoghania sp.]|uniref:hypothetical protein n=1 Tax=Breoghania sp. TaxID=2065378 RepID=UPI0026135441|nr:hypothetical protein [Breoghania sp.]MDJ0933392.1 hypothetical protein [Breoghania sp.]